MQEAPPLRAPATLAARAAAVWGLGYFSGALRPGTADAYPGCAVLAIRPHLDFIQNEEFNDPTWDPKLVSRLLPHGLGVLSKSPRVGKLPVLSLPCRRPCT